MHSDYKAVFDQADALTQAFRHSMEVGRDIERVRVRAALAAYDKALQDPSTKIPTYLHAAMEFLR